MSSRLQTAWTFSRVFLHNGACPAAVHIIACDYLPLMTHTTWELRLTGSLKCSLGNTAKMLQLCWGNLLHMTAWWLKTHADCIVKQTLELLIFLCGFNIYWTTADSMVQPIYQIISPSKQSINQPELEPFHWRFLCHAHVPGGQWKCHGNSRALCQWRHNPLPPHFHGSECWSPTIIPPTQRSCIFSRQLRQHCKTQQQMSCRQCQGWKEALNTPHKSFKLQKELFWLRYSQK